jgi:hypothetical protein
MFLATELQTDFPRRGPGPFQSYSLTSGIFPPRLRASREYCFSSIMTPGKAHEQVAAAEVIFALRLAQAQGEGFVPPLMPIAFPKASCGD